MHLIEQVFDSNKAVGNVDDYNTSTRSLAAATLRNILGTRNLGEILSERYSIKTLQIFSFKKNPQRFYCNGNEAYSGCSYRTMGSSC